MAILLQIGVILGFLVLVVYSKHLHIGLAPLNVAFSRRPNALGPLLPMFSEGKPIDFEDPGEDDIFGRGKIEDFTWKGLLDFATCTECGRCQSQCPAWNTEKPLSPKLLIMGLRDHAFAKAPYLIAQSHPDYLASQGGEHPAVPVELSDMPEAVQREAERPLVGPERVGRERARYRWGSYRPGRALVLYDVRRVRGAVPGRHRARRPHHRHASLPGHD